MERRVPAAAVGPRGLRDKVAMVRFPVVMVVTVAWAGMPRWRDRAWPVARVVMVGMGVLTAMAVLVAPGAAVGSVWMALMVPCSVRRARMVVPGVMAAGAALAVPAAVLLVMVVRGVWVVRVVVGVRVVRVVRVFRGRRRVVMGRLVGMVGMRVAGVSVVPVARGVVLEVVARVRVLMVVGVMVARVVRAGLAVLVVPGMTRPWMGMGVGAVMPVPVVMVARGVLGV